MIKTQLLYNDIRLKNCELLCPNISIDPFSKTLSLSHIRTVNQLLVAYEQGDIHLNQYASQIQLDGLIELIKYQYFKVKSDEIIHILDTKIMNSSFTDVLILTQTEENLLRRLGFNAIQIRTFVEVARTKEKGQDENLILSSKTRRHLKRLGFFKTAIKWIEEHLIDLLGEGRTIKIIDFLKEKQQNPYSFSFGTKEHSYYSIISVLLKMYQISYLPERKRVNEIAELKKELGDLVDNVALLNYKIQEVQKRLGTLQKQEEGMKFQRGKNK